VEASSVQRHLFVTEPTISAAAEEVAERCLRIMKRGRGGRYHRVLRAFYLCCQEALCVEELLWEKQLCFVLNCREEEEEDSAAAAVAESCETNQDVFPTTEKARMSVAASSPMAAAPETSSTGMR
jgi:hypothetical protein